MKKTVSIFILCMILVLSASFPVRAASKEQAMPVTVKAKAAVLMDADSGKVLMSNNMNEKLYPASVTKIMTMLLVSEAIDNEKISFDDKVTASANAVKKGGSQIWLKEGETMTVDELFKAMAVYSANDACTALAELVAGSEDAFIVMMNERAAKLGMKNTHFENCTGLDDTTHNHKTTAYDIALMARELMTHEFITKYTTIWMDSLRGGETQLVNTNKLVRFYSGCTGLKTGTTSKAGCCLCATATRDGTSLIAVVLGSDNSTDRFEGAKAMLNYGFANWSTVSPQVAPESLADVNIAMGKERKITPQLPASFTVLIPKGREADITQDISLAASVEAPVESGQKLGKIDLSLDGKLLCSYDLTAPHYVEKTTFLSVLKEILATFSK
ncbi:MAG: D-alanyl-D-alanine carboxypeptidase [Clostridia bacterium]|nr:D-alanyl-D-alanine carboxypeptidase [Clostridia bacterium]